MPKEIFYNHLRIIRGFLQEYQLWNQPLLVAISGGMDSVYLMQMLLELDQKISLAHINYQLRAEASEEDEQFVRDLAKNKDLQLYIKQINTPQLLENGGNMQILARTIRYDYFEELTNQYQFKGTITAHHRKDQAETIVRNFVHGAGLNGLMGMPAKNKDVYRPLLTIPEEEIREVMIGQDWDWREDHTNQEVNYDRNYIRHEVLPRLDHLNANAEERMAYTASLLQEAHWIVENYTDSFLKTNLIKIKQDTYSIKKSVLENHPALKTIIYCISKQLNLRETIIPEIIKLLDSHIGASIPISHLVIWNDREDLVFIKNETTEVNNELEISESSIQERRDVQFLNYDIALELVSDMAMEKLDHPDVATLYLNASNIEWPLKLRTWKQGDKMQPFGMKGYKKVSRIFIDEKIANHAKNAQVLLEDNKSILGILALKMSERTRVFEHTKKILQINFSTKRT